MGISGLHIFLFAGKQTECIYKYLLYLSFEVQSEIKAILPLCVSHKECKNTAVKKKKKTIKA